MKKKYLELTKEQRARGVIFASTLKGGGMPETTHEVTIDMEDAHERIERLLNDSFFNDSPFEYNEVRR